jgi:glycolate oxidase iron-sulfur subunit
MQTHLAPAYEGTPQGAQAQGVLRSCVHCGFCNATCPTYRVTGNELDGPRGRIYLMKQVFEGQAPTRTTQTHLDRCIGCRHCESTCPSGVQYHELLEVGQAVVDAQVARPWPERLRRWALRTVVPSRAFGPLLSLGRVLRPVLPQALAQHVPVAVAVLQAKVGGGVRRSGQPSAPLAPKRGRVILPVGCVQPHLSPNIDAATERVLAAMGLAAQRVRGAGCCGALKGHLGDRAGAQAQARANIDAWWPLVQGSDGGPRAQAIVVNASGCGAWAKDYDTLLADDPAYADKARRVAELIQDPAHGLPEWVPALKGLLKDRPAAMAPVAFHPPCSFSHVLGLSAAAKAGPVETSLRALGFDVKLAAVDSHQCCGAGGAYSLLQPEISSALKAAKVQALCSGPAASASGVISANIGCIAHLQSAMDKPVRHWIELLDEALSSAA